jgi:hypothetical protein
MRAKACPTVIPWRVVIVKVVNGDAAHLAALGLGKMPLAKGMPVAQIERSAQ